MEYSPSRRKFITGVGSYLSLCACGAIAAEDSFAPNSVNAGKPPVENPQKPPSFKESSLIGCHWGASASAANTQSRIKLFKTTGIADLDNGITREWDVLCNSMGVKPDFYMFDDGKSGNAFATPSILNNHQYPDGTVCFGITLMQEEFLATLPHGGRFDHVMMAIMAHEWAHIAQFQQIENPPPGKQMELHADAMAGWYVATRAAQFPNYVDVNSSMRSFFGKGDYSFNSPGHHGTPQERLHAFKSGMLGAQSGSSFSSMFFVAKQKFNL